MVALRTQRTQWQNSNKGLEKKGRIATLSKRKVILLFSCGICQIGASCPYSQRAVIQKKVQKWKKDYCATQIWVSMLQEYLMICWRRSQ